MKTTVAKRGGIGGMILWTIMGWTATPFVIGFGALLSPVLIGIPILLLGVFLPFFIPFYGFFKLKGKCPHCLQTVDNRMKNNFKCPHCARRIWIKGNTFNCG